MRTKALLCAAAMAAGVASSMAQSNVYSLNVVGYYNVPCPANQYVLIANQLNTTNNTLSGLIPSPPDGSAFQSFVGGGLHAYTYSTDDGFWTPDGSTVNLAPGNGGYFRSTAATTLTFVGEVEQGSLTNTLPITQFVVRSSIVPQTGSLMNDLGYPSNDGDVVQFYNGGFTAYTYSTDDGFWSPSDPTNYVGQSFFAKKASGGNSLWIRNFTVQ